MIEKIIAVIDEELQQIGGQKLTMPLLMEKELWIRTNRWESAGPELFRLKDRQAREYCIGPTHEEAFSQLVSETLTSYRDLPMRLYQIGTKFRDEMRPRGGLLRAREFIMKDLYSFDASFEDATTSYKAVSSAYERIFKRLQLPVVKVAADSGSVGGSNSEEFHVLSSAGADILLNCPSCGYAANAEKARSICDKEGDSMECERNVDVERHVDSLKLSQSYSWRVVSCGWESPQTPIEHVLVLVRGDHAVNPYAVKDFIRCSECVEMSPAAGADILRSLAAEARLRVLVDNSLAAGFSVDQFRFSKAGDRCTCGQGVLQEQRGIEVGHVFYLGQKYSKPMNITFDAADKTKKLVEMGCYGIGVSRLLAATAECCNDSKGLLWPPAMAPYTFHVIPIGKPGSSNYSSARTLSSALQSCPSLIGDVIVDDREIQPGARFADFELLGCPWGLVLGKQFEKDNKVEVIERHSNRRGLVSFDALCAQSLLGSAKLVECLQASLSS